MGNMVWSQAGSRRLRISEVMGTWTSSVMPSGVRMSTLMDWLVSASHSISVTMAPSTFARIGRMCSSSTGRPTTIMAGAGPGACTGRYGIWTQTLFPTAQNSPTPQPHVSVPPHPSGMLPHLPAQVRGSQTQRCCAEQVSIGATEQYPPPIAPHLTIAPQPSGWKPHSAPASHVSFGAHTGTAGAAGGDGAGIGARTVGAGAGASAGAASGAGAGGAAVQHTWPPQPSSSIVQPRPV
mmetsp:Transcript_73948/g.216599  ORF Transcript_73948/g.216599 Transcript_73948/m.216599 type:complete len:237 (-) Transcript_73948:2278-2988(-)